MYNIETLPYGGTYSPPERIVCAANRYEFPDKSGYEFLGIRHFDGIMSDAIQTHIEASGDIDNLKEIQGFMTSKHRFVDRHEAWKIAVEQQQIVRRVGGDTSGGGRLYSENLY